METDGCVCERNILPFAGGVFKKMGGLNETSERSEACVANAHMGCFCICLLLVPKFPAMNLCTHLLLQLTSRFLLLLVLRAGADILHSEGQYVGPDLEEQIYSNSTKVGLSVDVASAQGAQSEDHRAHNKRKLSACKGSSDTIPLKMRKLEVICNNIKEQPSEDLTRLRAENERLHQEIMESSETKQENQILRNEIEYLKQKLKEMYTRTENTKSNSAEELLKENENLKKEINVLYMNLGNFATAVQSTKDILAKNNDSISVMQQKFDEERKNFESFEAYKQVYTTPAHPLFLFVGECKVQFILPTHQKFFGAGCLQHAEAGEQYAPE